VLAGIADKVKRTLAVIINEVEYVLAVIAGKTKE
jgi:hypothetical protein